MARSSPPNLCEGVCDVFGGQEASAALCVALPLVAACWSRSRCTHGQTQQANPDQVVRGANCQRRGTATNGRITTGAVDQVSQLRSGSELEPEPEQIPGQRSSHCPNETSIEGLSLFTDVVDETLQRELVTFTDCALAAGRAGRLLGRTFQTQSPKWAARGQSREMLQYGVYTNSNRVEQSVTVAQLPAPLLKLRDVLVARGVFGDSKPPDCCCINIYSPGMWLPPHVDNLEFDRPFCTVSLISDQPVVFGNEITGTNGDWSGELSLMMPRGSALRVDGRAAGPRCKHAVPSPSSRRISMTFRRLSDESKQRYAEERKIAAAAAMAKIERKRAKKAAKKQAGSS